MDWVSEIDRMIAAKRVLKEADIENLWRYEAPNPPATEEAIRVAESNVGCSLDSEYVSFLRKADGWPAIHFDIDLFGTAELSGPRFREARELIKYLEPDVAAATGIADSYPIPIGASETRIDMFVMLGRIGKKPSSSVLWIAGYEIERYDRFLDFFRGMVSQNLDLAKYLRTEYDNQSAGGAQS